MDIMEYSLSQNIMEQYIKDTNERYTSVWGEGCRAPFKVLQGLSEGLVCGWGSRKEAGFWFPRRKQSSLSLICLAHWDSKSNFTWEPGFVSGKVSNSAVGCCRCLGFWEESEWAVLLVGRSGMVEQGWVHQEGRWGPSWKGYLKRDLERPLGVIGYMQAT